MLVVTVLDNLRKKLDASLNDRNWNDALTFCSSLLNENPKDFPTYVIKGQAHMSLQQYQDALTNYNVALSAGYSDGAANNWKNNLELCSDILGLKSK